MCICVSGNKSGARMKLRFRGRNAHPVGFDKNHSTNIRRHTCRNRHRRSRCTCAPFRIGRIPSGADRIRSCRNVVRGHFCSRCLRSLRTKSDADSYPFFGIPSRIGRRTSTLSNTYPSSHGVFFHTRGMPNNAHNFRSRLKPFCNLRRHSKCIRSGRHRPARVAFYNLRNTKNARTPSRRRKPCDMLRSGNTSDADPLLYKCHLPRGVCFPSYNTKNGHSFRSARDGRYPLHNNHSRCSGSLP